MNVALRVTQREIYTKPEIYRLCVLSLCISSLG